jgi:glycogen synthase
MMRYLTGRATRIAPQMVYHDPIMSIALRFLVTRSLLWLLGAPIWIGGPDVLRCNGWQTALAHALLAPEPRQPVVVYTI